LNTSPNGANYSDNETSWLSYCCTTPLPTNGLGNITNDPVFVDYAGGNLRLQSNSPCINAGANVYAVGGTDLDGRLRIVGGTVDMGAYEFQPGVSGVFIGWLQQYGLPTDGSADFADTDGDGMNNWQEWICLTSPTNALSVLRLLSAAPADTNVTLTWQSVAGASYYLLRSTNLAAWSAFRLLATNLAGQPGTTSYTDTNAAGLSPLYYRVGAGAYIPPAPPPPPTLNCLYDGGAGTIRLSWDGVGYRLQAQTNGPGAGLTTNWFDYPVALTSPVTVPVDPGNRSVFYRLIWP
jgi:hypothetical protein